MAAIAIQYPVSAIFLGISEIRTMLAGVGGILQGQSLYLDPTTGSILPSTAATAGKFAFRGVALNTAGVGQAVNVLEEGYVGGFDVSGMAFDALVYVSDTAGVLSTTAGTNSSVVGRVAAMSDRDPVTNRPSKVLWVRQSLI